MQFEKHEIHTVFLCFPNFYLCQNLSPSALADLFFGYPLFLGGIFMKNKKLIIAVAALVLVVAVLAAVYFATRPNAQEGSKAFTVTVIHADGSEKKFDYRTDAEKLGGFLQRKS